MAKLYPPAIAGTLPAFCGTETISVPFSMNRAVSPKEVAGFALKIKTVTGTYIATLTQTDSTKFNVDNDCVVTFTLSESIKTLVFNIGQHYKMQLAYIALYLCGAPVLTCAVAKRQDAVVEGQHVLVSTVVKCDVLRSGHIN